VHLNTTQRAVVKCYPAEGGSKETWCHIVRKKKRPVFKRFSQNCEKRLLTSCLSVRVEQLGSDRTDFQEIWYFSSSFFWKSVEKPEVWLKSGGNNGYFTWRRCTFVISRRILLKMRRVEVKIVEKIETHLMFNNFFSPWKSWLLWDNVEKYSRAREATDDNIIRRMRITTFMCRLFRNSGTSTSGNPKGPSRPVAGKLYLLPLLEVTNKTFSSLTHLMRNTLYPLFVV
jgi:hypothetical protein